MISIIGLLFILLLVIGLVSGILLWTTGGARSKHNEMSCGACDYAVRGLETVFCPECGADLREVGISPRASSGPRAAGMLLTFVCGFLTLLLFGMLFFYVQGPSPQAIPSQAIPTPNNTITSPRPVTGTSHSPSDETADDDASSSGDEPVSE
ncbi:MAG: hypothetical protein AAGB26_01870 [Planctomycetota bacterium]